MDWLAVLTRIKEGEDEQTEFKRDVDLKKIGKAIGGFANTDGGMLVLGVDDDGTHIGITEDPERVSERLTSYLHSGLSAPVQARLGRKQTPAGWIHWIEIPRQRGFEPLRHNGLVYVRRGRASVEPGGPELAELYNAFGYFVTEERTIAASSIDDIDLTSFAEYLRRLGLDLDAEPRIHRADDLRARGVLAPLGDSLCGTVYGVLAFGLQPQSFTQTQNFFVQCVSYGGTDRADEVLQVADAKGRLDDQVARTLGWVAGLGRREVYEGARRTDVPFVPLPAVREAIVNAVAHRDYAIIGSKILVEHFVDRLEITSPGSLPNGLTPTSVVRGGNPRASSPRRDSPTAASEASRLRGVLDAKPSSTGLQARLRGLGIEPTTQSSPSNASLRAISARAARNQSITNYLLTMGRMEQRGRGWPIMARSMMDHNGTSPVLEEDRDARWVRVILWTRAAAGEQRPEGGV